MNKVPFYRYSIDTAKREGNLDLWHESHRENMNCRQYIDSKQTGLSATAYDGFHVDRDRSYTKAIIDKFGYERVMHVLTNTVRATKTDGRWSQQVKDWAKSRYEGTVIPHNSNEYVLNTHTGLVDILAKSVIKEYENLNLFNHTHCCDGNLNYEKQVVVISPQSLKEEYWKPEFQLWYANHGNGCNPNGIGTGVFATCLYDGDKNKWARANVVGVIKDEFLPDWAKEKLKEIKNPQQEDIKGGDMSL